MMGDPKPTASLSGGLLARKGGARPAMRRPTTDVNSGSAAASQDDLGWNDMGYDVNPAPETPMDHDHEALFNPLANAVPEATPEVRKQQERIAQQLQAQPETDYPTESIDQVNNASSLQIGGTWHPGPEEEQAVAKPKAEPYDEGALTAGLSKMVSASVAGAKAKSTVNLGPVEAIEPIEEIVEAELPVTKAVQEPVKAPVASRVESKISKLVAQEANISLLSKSRKPRKRAAAGSKSKAAFTLRLDKERHLKLRLACAVSNKSAQMLVTEALDRMLDEMPEIDQLAANVPDKIN